MPRRKAPTGRGRGRLEHGPRRAAGRTQDAGRAAGRTQDAGRAAGRMNAGRTTSSRRGRGAARRGRGSAASPGTNRDQAPTPVALDPLTASTLSARPNHDLSQVATPIEPGIQRNGEFLAWPICPGHTGDEQPGEGTVAAVANTFGPPPSAQSENIIGIGDRQGMYGDQVQATTQPLAVADLSDDLGSGVQLALKERIWNGEYVELGQLLKMHPSPLDQSLVLAVDSVGGGLQLRPQSRSPSIRSIEQWTSAMIVFVSIYAERHLSRVRELLKYVTVVRTAAECGYNWKDYDVQFRLRHARQPHMSWARVDTELWLLVATAQMRNFRTYGGKQPSTWFPKRGGRRPFQQSTGGTRPRNAGVCFAFNSGQCPRGRQCRYQHKCQRCGDSSHGAAACSRPPSSK